MRRQTDVAETGLRGERVRRLVEPPGLRVVAKRVEHKPPCFLLTLDRIGAGDLFDRILSMAIDELHELTLQAPEDLLEPSGREPFLVLVEENVVWVLRRGKARDIATLELELPFEMRAERLEVRCSFRLVPGGNRHATHLHHLSGQLRWDPRARAPSPAA